MQRLPLRSHSATRSNRGPQRFELEGWHVCVFKPHWAITLGRPLSLETTHLEKEKHKRFKKNLCLIKMRHAHQLTFFKIQECRHTKNSFRDYHVFFHLLLALLLLLFLSPVLLRLAFILFLLFSTFSSWLCFLFSHGCTCKAIE